MIRDASVRAIFGALLCVLMGGFCLVASSQVDAFIEVAKGYAWHDIVAGAHILREAGGIIKDMGFDDLIDPLDPSVLGASLASPAGRLDELSRAWGRTKQLRAGAVPKTSELPVARQRFIAAATYELVAKIAIDLAMEKKGQRPM
jgi:hypothetical protein